MNPSEEAYWASAFQEAMEFIQFEEIQLTIRTVSIRDSKWFSVTFSKEYDRELYSVNGIYETQQKGVCFVYLSWLSFMLRERPNAPKPKLSDAL